MLHVQMSNDLHTLAQSTAASLKTAIDGGDLAVTSEGDHGGDELSQRVQPFFDAVRVYLSRLLS